MALATKHFSNLSVKHRFPSQRSRFDSRSGKHPWILFWCSVTVLVIEYRRRCRSFISVKILASAYVEPNLGRGWRVGVWRRWRMNKPLGQKGFLIKSEVQDKFLVEFLGRRGKILPYRYLFRYPYGWKRAWMTWEDGDFFFFLNKNWRWLKERLGD